MNHELYKIYWEHQLRLYNSYYKDQLYLTNKILVTQNNEWEDYYNIDIVLRNIGFLILCCSFIVIALIFFKRIFFCSLSQGAELIFLNASMNQKILIICSFDIFSVILGLPIIYLSASIFIGSITLLILQKIFNTRETISGIRISQLAKIPPLYHH